MSDDRGTPAKYSTYPKRTPNQESEGCLAVLSLCFLIGGMWWSLSWTFPDGSRMDFWGFVQFWCRELLLVIVPVMALTLIAVVIVVRWIKALFAKLLRGLTKRD